MKLPERDHLHPAEVRVLALIADGCGDEEIGEKLAVSPHTIKSQVRAIRHVLGARNRTHAVAKAFRSGLIS